MIVFPWKAFGRYAAIIPGLDEPGEFKNLVVKLKV